jgi:hypothetical protein
MFRPTWPSSGVTNSKGKANRQIHTQETTTKINEEKQHRKNKWKRAECDLVKKGRKPSEANSFRHMKIRIFYTPEDGHVGRNM